jgi:N-acetyl sugar amidotransferase
MSFAENSSITYCKKCLTPSSRPRISINDAGVCNACENSKEKTQIDWNEREKELLEILKKHRSKIGNYDCVVPWSGGKDSSSIAHKLKFKYNMNPLLVTFSPLIINEVGNHNREALINSGFDSIFFRPNQKISRLLSKRFFIERGNPKVHWDAGINAIPVEIALKFNIKLIFYAEHGESEYGGRVLDEEKKKIRDLTEVIEHQIGDDPSNWLDSDVTENDLKAYKYPDSEIIESSGLKCYYFSYFTKWDMFDNYNYIKDKIDFRLDAENRSTGTFTNFDSLDDKIDDLYYYMQYIKFGFGRCIRDASRFIQNGHLTRENALDLVKKFDGEFPKRNYDSFLNYLSLSDVEFKEIVDKHRNPEVWRKMNDKSWKLIHPPK